VVKHYTIFGGSGFIGRYVVQELARTGARLRIATRDPHKALFLKPLTRLGQLGYVQTDIHKPESIAHAIEGADGVINLVGILTETGRASFDDIHVTTGRNIAEAATRAGVNALVHVSANGADPESGSDYARSKGEGELAVRKAFPAATIVRPSVVFGPEDNFLNRFAGLMRFAPVMPVIAPETKFQPAYVTDVARAIAAAVAEPEERAGKTYTLGGPDVMTMRALLEWVARTTDRQPNFVNVPKGTARLLARLTGWLPGAPITYDQWLILQTDNVVPEGAEGFAAFGIQPAPLAAVAPAWLTRFRPRGRFDRQTSLVA
jgi:NADH dehydrogenase